MHRMAIACSILLTSSVLGSAGDGMKFEKKILGSWGAEKAPNRLLTRLVISQDDRGFWVEVWAVRGLQEEAVQKAPLHLLRAGIGEKGPVERGFATWKEGAGEAEATLYATLRFHEVDLVLELSKVYREPRSSSWFTSFALKKRVTAPVVMGKVADPNKKHVEGATITVSMRDEWLLRQAKFGKGG